MAPSIISDESPILLIASPTIPIIATKNGKLVGKKITSSLLHRSLNLSPHLVQSASGIYLYIESPTGPRTILDACTGAAVAVIGHGNTEVAAAVAAQMQSASYVHTLSYTTPVAEELAAFMLEDSPFKKAYFVGSGSEAMDAALKLARQYWFERGEEQRIHYISRKQGYHGNTIGAMSVSSNVARKIQYGNLQLENMSWVSPANAYRYQLKSESSDEYVARLAAELEEEILRVGENKVIAFVAETVVGATTGGVPPPKGYFKAVRAVCDKYGVLLILDEIMCGIGRSGTMFSFSQDGVEPDMITVGKGLGGGYAPISGVFVGGTIIDVLQKGTAAFNHGHTFQSHPVSCAAALAVQKIVRREGLIENCARMGKILEAMLRERFKDCKYVGNIRGRGLFWGLEFVKDRETKEPLDRSLGFGARVQLAAFERGVAIYPGAGTADGIDGDHVLVAPPFNVTEKQLVKIVDVLRDAYDSQESCVV